MKRPAQPPRALRGTRVSVGGGALKGRRRWRRPAPTDRPQARGSARRVRPAREPRGIPDPGRCRLLPPARGSSRPGASPAAAAPVAPVDRQRGGLPAPLASEPAAGAAGRGGGRLPRAPTRVSGVQRGTAAQQEQGVPLPPGVPPLFHALRCNLAPARRRARLPAPAWPAAPASSPPGGPTLPFSCIHSFLELLKLHRGARSPPKMLT